MSKRPRRFKAQRHPPREISSDHLYGGNTKITREFPSFLVREFHFYRRTGLGGADERIEFAANEYVNAHTPLLAVFPPPSIGGGVTVNVDFIYRGLHKEMRMGLLRKVRKAGKR